MVTKTAEDGQVMREALEVLLEHLGPIKVARFLAMWRETGGNYVEVRDQLFAGKSVDDLVRMMRESRGKDAAS